MKNDVPHMLTSLLTVLHFSITPFSGMTSPVFFMENGQTRSVIIECRGGKSYRARSAGKRGGAVKRIRRGRA